MCLQRFPSEVYIQLSKIRSLFNNPPSFFLNCFLVSTSWVDVLSIDKFLYLYDKFLDTLGQAVREGGFTRVAWQIHFGYLSQFNVKLEKIAFLFFPLSDNFRNCNWVRIDGEKMWIMEDYCCG